MTHMTTVSDNIEVLFLGTGAADWPAQYCPLIDDAGVGTVRGHSSVIVDGQILIDCGATVPKAIDH